MKNRRHCTFRQSVRSSLFALYAVSALATTPLICVRVNAENWEVFFQTTACPASRLPWGWQLSLFDGYFRIQPEDFLTVGLVMNMVPVILYMEWEPPCLNSTIHSQCLCALIPARVLNATVRTSARVHELRLTTYQHARVSALSFATERSGLRARGADPHQGPVSLS